MSEITNETVRELLREVLSERDRQAAEEQQAQAAREADELSRIRRKDLTPKQVSQLVERLGKDGYLALPYDDQPRGSLGRFAHRR
jgi:hypothetical protein